MTDGQVTARSLSESSIFRWAVKAWRDAFDAFWQMPTALGMASLAMLALQFLSVPFLPSNLAKSSGISVKVTLEVFMIASVFVLTPAAIAVHRFVLLGERAASYRLDPVNPRFRRFFFFVVAFQLVVDVPSLMTLGLISQAQDPSWYVQASVLGLWVLIFAGLFLMLRSLVLFPAIALDAPGMGWREAFRATRGHNWRILVIAVATGIPIAIAYVLRLSFPDRPDEIVARGVIISAILDTVWFMLTTVVYAALASRMFAALVDRPAGSAERPATA